MRFPLRFDRKVNGATSFPDLGSDSTPTLPLASQPTNMLPSRFSNVNGWPCHRIAVTYLYTGAGPAPVLPARLLFPEDQTNAWYQIGPDQNLVTGHVAFFDVIALLDTPNTAAGITSPQGVASQSFLQVDKPSGAPDGVYTFCMAPDLTTSP